jgi:hypothetical protein
MSANNNQYPVNMSNVNIPQNSINQMNQINPMNLLFLNSGISNINLQNNIQMNQSYYLNKLTTSMENCDLMSFQAIITELLEHQSQIYLNPIKNNLLNKAILLYLSLYNQGNSQYALKQMITLLLMKLKANPNIRLRYSNGPNNYNLNINNMYFNNSAIFPIVEKNDIELVKVFLDNNLDIQVKDNLGRNSLFYLMISPNNKDNLIDRRPLCSLLLSRQIKINYLDNNGISPIMEAINKGYIQLMSMFIKYNGDVNLINPNDGNTALHYAILKENQDALFILLGKGNCDLSIKNYKNETAFDLAKKLNSESNKEIYELIMKFDNSNNNNNGASNKKEKKSISNTDNGKVFMFPPKEDISSRIEFPFSFQNKPILNSNDNGLTNSTSSGNNDNFNNTNQLSSLIKMENTPILYLDISDEAHQNNLIYDGLKNESQSLDKTLDQKQNNLVNFRTENENLINELNKLKNELLLKNQEINILTEQKTKEENKFIYQRQLNQTQIEQKDMAIQSLLINFKNLEKEINEEYNKETQEKIMDDKNSEISTDIGSKYSQNLNEKQEVEIDNIKFKYLEKKFSEEKYTDNEVINLLTTDLYDFYHYNKMIYDNRIQEINKTLTILKKIIDIEAEIKLYGSYATKTSLLWSEVDLLIIPNMGEINCSENNIYANFIQKLCHKLQSSGIKVEYIDDCDIITPIIKIKVGEPSLVYNLFVFDNTNFSEIKNLEDNSLIKSIILTNEYANKYKEKFIPLLLGIKQLLYSANLINNYYYRNNDINMDNINMNLNNNENYTRGISSYALNIMLMSFLDNYNCITEEIPLGLVFIDFLKIYGYLLQDNTNNRIIFLDYDNNGHRDKIEEIKYTNDNGIDRLIIVDPFNIRNNLTEKMISIPQFEIIFMIAFSVIKDSCECACHYNENSHYQGKIHCILNKIFKTVKRFTSIRKK